MPGLIERHASVPLILKQRIGVSDGKPVYAELACRGLVLSLSQSDFDAFGSIQTGKVFLIAPFAGGSGEPVLPGRVVYGGREYEMKTVKVYRNLRGELLGYRVAAAGGA